MLNLLGLLRNPIIAGALALLVGLSAGFLRGYSAGSDAARVAHLEAEIAAEKDRARRLERIRSEQDNRIADLQHALEQIDAEPSIESAGASCRLDPDFMRRLTARYNQDWRGSATIPIPDQRVH